MANLLQTALELGNSCTGYCVHVAAVATLKEVVGNTRDHGSVVAAKLEWRKDAVEVGTLGQHCAETGVCCNTAATDNGVEAGVVCGFQ